MRERGVVGMKCQRNKRYEAVGFILKLAKFKQVVHTLFLGFHVAIKHGGIGSQPDFVRLASDAQPHLSAGFMVANNLAHARVKDLRAAAGQGVYTGVFHFLQRVLDGKFGNARKISDFHHGEGFQVHGGAPLFQAANHFQEIFKRQIRMQPADNMKFRGAFAHTLFAALINLFERKVVGARRIGIAAKRAKLAVRHTNVSGIDVPVYVEVGNVPVTLFANVIGKPADRQQIG